MVNTALAGLVQLTSPHLLGLKLARIINILWLEEKKAPEHGKQALEEQHDFLHKAPCPVTAHLCGNSEINKRAAGEPDVDTSSADGTCPTLNSVLQKIS